MRTLPAGAQVVNGTGDQFFACARLPLNEDNRIGRGDSFNRLQGSFQRVTVTDDLSEAVLGADLLFQVEFLLGQLIFQFGDLPGMPARSQRQSRSAWRPR